MGGTIAVPAKVVIYHPDPASRAAVGERVRRWRLHRGLTQRDLAQLAGVRQATLSNYERGQRELALHVLLLICAALEVPLGALVPTASEDGEVVVVRGSKLGRAIQALRERPGLLQILIREEVGGGLQMVPGEPVDS